MRWWGSNNAFESLYEGFECVEFGKAFKRFHFTFWNKKNTKLYYPSIGTDQILKLRAKVGLRNGQSGFIL